MITQTRFKDASWFPRQEEYVLIGGAGGIGSWLTVLLARVGFEPILYDFDHVEEHNLGGQLFTQKHIGLPKVKAVSNLVEEFAGKKITTFTERITHTSPSHHFVFSAFDNMKARRDMFNSWKALVISNSNQLISPIFIDGRLEMEQLQIFCVTPENMYNYETEYLFDDSRVEDAPCTLKQSSHTAAIIAGTMVSFFTNHISNINLREKHRFIPFYYELSIPLVLTTTF